MESFWDRFGIVLRSFLEHSGIVLGSCFFGGAVPNRTAGTEPPGPSGLDIRPSSNRKKRFQFDFKPGDLAEHYDLGTGSGNNPTLNPR